MKRDEKRSVAYEKIMRLIYESDGVTAGRIYKITKQRRKTLNEVLEDALERGHVFTEQGKSSHGEDVVFYRPTGSYSPNGNPNNVLTTNDQIAVSCLKQKGSQGATVTELMRDTNSTSALSLKRRMKRLEDEGKIVIVRGLRGMYANIVYFASREFADAWTAEFVANQNAKKQESRFKSLKSAASIESFDSVGSWGIFEGVKFGKPATF